VNSKQLLKYSALGGVLSGFLAAPGVASALSNNDTQTPGTTGKVDVTLNATLGGSITLYIDAKPSTSMTGTSGSSSGTVDFGTVDALGNGNLTGVAYPDSTGNTGTVYVAEMTASVEYTGYNSVDITITGTKTANFNSEADARWGCGGTAGSGAWTGGNPVGGQVLSPANTGTAPTTATLCANLIGGAGQPAASTSNTVAVDLALYFSSTANPGTYSATYNFTAIGVNS